MQDRLAVERTDVSLDGMLLERMSDAGIELIIGARNEGGWGPVILVGLGGILTEVLQDVVFIPAGVGRSDIARALRSLKGARLFDGYRGSPPADVEATINVVETLGAFLLQHPEVLEADLNPVRGCMRARSRVPPCWMRSSWWGMSTMSAQPFTLTLIDGDRVAGETMFDVVNPATADIFAQAPDATRAQLDLAVAAARRAFEIWRTTSRAERREALLAFANEIRSETDSLSRPADLRAG